MSDFDLGAAPSPVSDHIATFDAEIAASRKRLEDFAKANGEGLEADDEAFLAYDELTAFDKILYRELAAESAFRVVCHVESYLAIQVQSELKKCRDPATPIPINGVWEQNTFRAAKAFFEEAEYWEWTKDAIDLTAPSFKLLELIRKVRAESYGGVCRNNPPFDEPILDVEATCDRLVTAR